MLQAKDRILLKRGWPLPVDLLDQLPYARNIDRSTKGLRRYLRQKRARDVFGVWLDLQTSKDTHIFTGSLVIGSAISAAHVQIIQEEVQGLLRRHGEFEFGPIEWTSFVGSLAVSDATTVLDQHYECMHRADEQFGGTTYAVTKLITIVAMPTGIILVVSKQTKDVYDIMCDFLVTLLSATT